MPARPGHASILLVLGVLGAAACTSATDAGPDLPSGWERAERIDDFVQRPCSGSAYEDIPATIEAEVSNGAIALEYGAAHFRCEQDVEGFVRRDAAEPADIDVLVQPVDMNPRAVAGCDCLYDLSMKIAAEAGSYRLTVYRRWDNINDPNDPVDEGSISVDVE